MRVVTVLVMELVYNLVRHWDFLILFPSDYSMVTLMVPWREYSREYSMDVPLDNLME